MKSAIFLFTLFTCLGAFASLPENFQSYCDTPEALKLQGKNGSCRTVINPKPLTIKGSCRGKVLESLYCEIAFDSFQKSSHIVCGDDPEAREVESDLAAEFTEFRAASIVSKKAKGIFRLKDKTVIINDPVTYKTISTVAFNIFFEEKVEGSKPVVRPSIFWINDGGNLEFQDVKCELTSGSVP